MTFCMFDKCYVTEKQHTVIYHMTVNSEATEQLW